MTRDINMFILKMFVSFVWNNSNKSPVGEQRENVTIQWLDDSGAVGRRNWKLFLCFDELKLGRQDGVVNQNQVGNGVVFSIDLRSPWVEGPRSLQTKLWGQSRGV